MAEASGSSAVYTLLKREDEKYVTEHAFAQPTFVEDVVRNVAQRLTEHEHVRWFRVEVESMESIHATCERRTDRPSQRVRKPGTSRLFFVRYCGQKIFPKKFFTLDSSLC